MRTITRLALAAVTAAMAGCASGTADLHREPIVKPGLIALTPEQAAQRGLRPDAYDHAPSPLPASPGVPLDSGAVALPPDIEVYPLGRTVDAANPDLMHEAHVVYRRTGSRWKLDAPTDQKILVGPRVTDGRGELQPVLSKELVTYLRDQRKVSEENQKAITALFQALDAISKQQQALAREQATRTPDRARNASDGSPGDAQPQER